MRVKSVIARRVVQLVLALAVVIGVSVSTAGVAAAAGVGEHSCRFEANRYNVCILISHRGFNAYDIHVGIDVVMSQEYAQSIIDLPGEPFSASLYGDDPIWDDHLMYLGYAGISAWPGGLSAEFHATAFSEQLDEDGGESDEIFAEVWLFLPWPATSRSFRTNTVNYRF